MSCRGTLVNKFRFKCRRNCPLEDIRPLIVTTSLRFVSSSTRLVLPQQHSPQISPHRSASSLIATNNTDAAKAKENAAIATVKIIANSTVQAIRNPHDTWQMVKHEAHHYWVGTKLLWIDIKLTTGVLYRVLKGHGMTRRERNQLMRTSMDLFRLVPFAIIVIVPFMELSLPFLLQIFPNMLPSTFQVRCCRCSSAHCALLRLTYYTLQTLRTIDECYATCISLCTYSNMNRSLVSLHVVPILTCALLCIPLSLSILNRMANRKKKR
jgi:LETM1-like protein